MLTHRAYTTVRQVVNIVNLGLVVDQGNYVTHNGDNVFLGQYQVVIVDIGQQLAVDFETTYFAKVVTLVGEEQFINDTASRLVIRWIRTAQLAVDIVYRFYFTGSRVLRQGIVDDGKILFNILALQDDSRHIGVVVQDEFDVLFIQYCIAFENDLVTCNGHHLTGVFVYEVFCP